MFDRSPERTQNRAGAENGTDALSGQNVIEVGWTGWPHGVTDAAEKVIVALGTAGNRSHLTVVVSEPPVSIPQRHSLVEALRGIVHSSVRERPQLRVNLVVGGTPEDRDSALRYLDTATFAYGTTIDLGRQS